MRRTQGGGGFGFNVQLTPLAKNTLIALVGLYVVQLVLMYWAGLPLDRWLYLNPLRSGSWAPWQLLSAHLFNSHHFGLSVFFDWLMVYFFASQVERMFTTRKYLKAMAFVGGFAMLVTTALDAAGALVSPAPFVGQGAFTLALVAFFCLSLPHAQLTLFPIPVQLKASWVGWGAGFIALIYFVINRDLGSTVSLFSWVGAWLWLNGGDYIYQLRRRKARRDRERELSRFTVHQGGKDGDEYIH